MKELSSVRPALVSATTNSYRGRSGRQLLGDLPASNSNSAPVKSFPTTLERFKSGGNTTSVSQNATSGGRGSNTSILAAIGANVSPVRQNAAVAGAGRLPSGPTRVTQSQTPGTNPTTTNTPTPPAATPAGPKFTAQQQKWLDANAGAYGNILKANLARTENLTIESVDVRWSNGSTGKPEYTQRAVGNVSSLAGQELASMLGGTLVNSPFETFGTTQRDQYIRMSNGQMVEASVLANQLNAARGASDPFSATQNVLDVYRKESEQFDLARSTNAVDLVTKGILRIGLPQVT